MHVLIDADRYDDSDDLTAAIEGVQADQAIDRITIAEARAGRWVRWRRSGTGAWDVDSMSVTTAS